MDRKTTGQKDIRTERQQDRNTTGQKDNRIIWASRAHGMTQEPARQQDRKALRASKAHGMTLDNT